MLQHYVFIRYQKGVAEAHVAEFCRRMLELRTRITGIEHLEIGRDMLHDARSWDLVLIMRFVSLETLRAYQQHPEHQQVMQFNQPFVVDVGSVDFIEQVPIN